MKLYQVGIYLGDERESMELEEKIISFFGNLNLDVNVTIWSTLDECMNKIQNEQWDMLFLSADPPYSEGILVGRHIRESLCNWTIQLIYLTFDQTISTELFRVHPYDVLNRPVCCESVKRSLTDYLTAEAADGPIFSYQVNRIRKKIHTGRIMYFAGKRRHIEMFVIDGTSDEFVGKIESLEKLLPASFVRVSQSFIINIRYVSESRYNCVKMYDGTIINISRPYRISFRMKEMEYER